MDRGYVLHTYPYKETSLILQAWTEKHGRLGLVAKGARRPRSASRPVTLVAISGVVLLVVGLVLLPSFVYLRRTLQTLAAHDEALVRDIKVPVASTRPVGSVVQTVALAGRPCYFCPTCQPH